MSWKTSPRTSDVNVCITMEIKIVKRKFRRTFLRSFLEWLKLKINIFIEIKNIFNSSTRSNSAAKNNKNVKIDV